MTSLGSHFNSDERVLLNAPRHGLGRGLDIQE